MLQQAEVLRQHLGAHRVAHFVGEMGCDLWEKDRWAFTPALYSASVGQHAQSHCEPTLLAGQSDALCA